VLRDRWAGWDRSPFTGDSTSHVSVWQKADGSQPRDYKDDLGTAGRPQRPGSFSAR
jgi:hypothetical protein